MGGKANFDRSECVRALLAIGFTKKKSKRAPHEKYIFPSHVVTQPGERPFIMVPHGKLRCQDEILKELRLKGLESSFIENL